MRAKWSTAKASFKANCMQACRCSPHRKVDRLTAKLLPNGDRPGLKAPCRKSVGAKPTGIGHVAAAALQLQGAICNGVCWWLLPCLSTAVHFCVHESKVSGVQPWRYAEKQRFLFGAHKSASYAEARVA